MSARYYDRVPNGFPPNYFTIRDILEESMPHRKIQIVHEFYDTGQFVEFNTFWLIIELVLFSLTLGKETLLRYEIEEQKTIVYVSKKVQGLEELIKEGIERNPPSHDVTIEVKTF